MDRVERGMAYLSFDVLSSNFIFVTVVMVNCLASKRIHCVIEAKNWFATTSITIIKRRSE